MKYFQLVIFLLIVFTIPQKALSQGYNTVASLHHLSFENRVISLGQATAVLNNYGSYHANPAIPYTNGELGFSSFIPSFDALTVPRFYMENEDIAIYNPAISFGYKNWSFSASFDYTNVPEFDFPGSGTEPYTPYYHITRGNAGYQLSKNFSVGVGVAHIKDFQGYDPLNNERAEYSGMTYSLGSYYNSELESSDFLIKPQAGLVITDIADKFTTEIDGFGLLPPAQIRWGLGVDFTHKKEMYNQSVFSFGIYTGFSKYLSRVEEDLNQPTGIAAIFGTWNSFQRFNGMEYETLTLGDQISKSVGIEAGFLETLYLRFGTFGGADFWVMPQTNYGVALDFYYLSVSYTHVHYNKTDGYLITKKNQSAFQMQVRIPLDGKTRTTLLGELFNL